MLTNKLLTEIGNEEVVVNLASKEYSKAINLKAVINPIITPVFKEQKGDGYKVVMMYAKKARGTMTQFLLKNRIQTIEEVKSFDLDGYSFNPAYSTDTEFTFTR